MNRRVKLRREDGVQIVDVPREMELPGDEALLRSENGRLVLEPIGLGDTRRRDLIEFLKTLKPLAPEDRMPEINDDDLLPLNDDDIPFADVKL